MPNAAVPEEKKAVPAVPAILRANQAVPDRAAVLVSLPVLCPALPSLKRRDSPLLLPLLPQERTNLLSLTELCPSLPPSLMPLFCTMAVLPATGGLAVCACVAWRTASLSL